LLQVHSLDIAPREILDMENQRIGVFFGVIRERRNEVLEVGIGPRITC
jgi:hypothetical protein